MLSGSVVRGEQRGRSLGWPTANLHPPRDRVIPADGVYAAKAVCEGQRYDAAVYIGTRPTFGGVERLLEVYLLDEARDLYGQDLAVEFVQRLRGDMVFSTPEELSVRIDRDVALARESLKDVPLHR
jgi:riboflavin kinase/FMN adenylyltransferase